ncbi:TPA: hypothetical protein OXK33_002007 [Acinetobacter baumannii]|nr:hypothetical protein [Acinetobacter baumannii]MCT9553467.1 hypothetical protein [Acinetobacter baumannii]MCT9556953.1 hypothetical protein [Acinetobacter baumannii]HCW3751245.1 hypothetical protein [Acinetobacter baumannii]
MIQKSIINNRLSFHELGRESKQPHIVLELEGPAVLRKQMELNLVKLIQEYQRKGLDMKYINIDLLNGVDARVTLNETTQTAKQTTGDDTEDTET